MKGLPSFLTKLSSFRNWSRIGKGLDHADVAFLQQKRNILLSQYCILGAFLVSLHIIYDLSIGNYLEVGMEFLMILFLLVVYLLNENKRSTLAKILFVVFINLYLFVFAILVPKTHGVYLLFYPLVAANIALFSRKQALLRNSFVGLSLLLLFVLEVVDYTWYFEKLGNNADAYSFIINLNSSIVIMALTINFILSIHADIEREIKEKEHKEEKLAKELAKQNKILQKANRELDHFVYSASHDLRAPLMSIKGLINLATYETKEKEILKYFEMMEERIQNLDNFIQEIIYYSRNSRMQIEKKPVDFNELTESVIKDLNYMKGANEIKLNRDYQFEEIKSDFSRLKVILNNLVSNAIKYHDYSKKSPKIDLTVRQDDAFWYLTVADNGKGIEKEYLEHIFKMFFRASEESEGSGLGLYIVKEVVDRLAGSIEVDSTINVGTTVKLKIPN